MSFFCCTIAEVGDRAERMIMEKITKVINKATGH